LNGWDLGLNLNLITLKLISVGRLFAGADFQLAMPFEIKKIEKLMGEVYQPY
jgi:hypothetical protein